MIGFTAPPRLSSLSFIYTSCIRTATLRHLQYHPCHNLIPRRHLPHSIRSSFCFTFTTANTPFSLTTGTRNTTTTTTTTTTNTNTNTTTATANSTYNSIMEPMDETILADGGIAVTCEERSQGYVVTVELTRERTLNALRPETFQALHLVFDSLPTVSQNVKTQVILLGRGRAFSAGGDVRSLRSKVLAVEEGVQNVAKRRATAASVLSTEYNFLSRLAKLRKHSDIETIAVSDGVTFGAGNGLFQVCKYRLVTSRSLICMPECMIGLIPDCGATHFLVGMPAWTGLYAALTGYRFIAGDCIKLRLADGAVHGGWKGDSLTGWNGIPGMLNQMTDTETHLSIPNSEIRKLIDDVFSKDSVDAIVSRLDQLQVACNDSQEQQWVKDTKQAIVNASPRAVFETFRTMTEGYQLLDGLDAALQRELEVDSDLASRWDFEEGVRAALVDKDHQPKWESFNADEYDG